MFVILSLRMTKIGINFENFRKKFKKDFTDIFFKKIEFLRSEKLIKIFSKKILLTKKSLNLLGFVEKVFYEE